MTFSTWTSGTHRVTDLAAWMPSVPESSDDTGFIGTGHGLSLYQTLGPYSIILDGADPTAATFDAVDTTFTGFLGGRYIIGSPGDPAYGTLGLLGTNTSDGTIGTFSNYQESSTFPQLDIKLADLASATAVIQQATLINNGTLYVGEGSPVTITGPTDAVMVNNGGITSYGDLDISVAVTGTGTIEKTSAPREQGSTLTFASAVSAGQTLTIDSGRVVVDDPLNFRATVTLPLFYLGSVYLHASVTAASFIGSTLSLFDDTALVAQFKIKGDIPAADIAVMNDGNGQTEITNAEGYYSSPITVTTTGAVPVAPTIVLPAPVVLLPRFGSDITTPNAALVASNGSINNYTITFTNPSDTTQASLSLSSATLGGGITLVVGGSSADPSYGDLYLVGNNLNQGLIEAKSASTLTVSATDAVGPDGYTLVPSTFYNSGEIVAQTGATINITSVADSKLINQNTVSDQGIIFIGPTVTGAGTITIGAATGAGASLELGAAVGYEQTIDFLAGTLTFDNAKLFRGKIDDVSSEDKIVLKNVDVSKVAYQNGALLLDGGAEGVLRLSGPSGIALNTNSFILTHSGQDSVVTTSAHPV